jgi:hypothetical protein
MFTTCEVWKLVRYMRLYPGPCRLTSGRLNYSTGAQWCASETGTLQMADNTHNTFTVVRAAGADTPQIS